MSTLLADPTAARGKAMRAVQILDPLGPSRALALAYSTVAAQDTLLAHFADARGWSERALNLAHETDSEDVVAHALGYRGLVKCSSGNESGFADLQEAVRIAERIDHADYLTVSAHNLAVMLIRFGRVLQAKPYLDIAEQVALDHRLEAARFRIEAQQCHVLIWQGLWDEAERRLRVLVESAADAGASAVNPLAFLGRVLSRRGDPAAARLIERGWELAVASGEDQKRAVAAAARIERLWLTGDRAAVRTVGTELLPVAVRTRHHVLHAEVLRYLRRAGVQVVTFPGCPPPFAAGIGGDWQIAADLWERAGNPYEQALELSESPNVAVVVQALNILDRLGATAASAIVRRRLRRDGVRNIPRGPRSTTKVNPGQLTDRQLEILSLLDEGCTSAEIADRLFLSRRTVDNHVSAVLHRLGVTSRRAALDVAARAAFLRREAREN
jgi:DNA-binding CsgD family transcriptional regulator